MFKKYVSFYRFRSSAICRFRFRELFPEQAAFYETDSLVRSELQCRSDLLKWGAQFGKNGNRPYFEGHEREDVVKKRKEFVQKLIWDKEKCHYPTKDDKWESPQREKRILRHALRYSNF